MKRILCVLRGILLGNKKGARRQIGKDLLRLGKGSLWGHFAAPPHFPKSLVDCKPFPVEAKRAELSSTYDKFCDSF